MHDGALLLCSQHSLSVAALMSLMFTQTVLRIYFF